MPEVEKSTRGTHANLNDTGVWQIIQHWWQALQSDSGTRARLRRANSTSTVALEYGYNQLVQRLHDAKSIRIKQKYMQENLPAVVRILAHVREDNTTQSVAGSMRGVHSQRAIISDLRFRRLIQIKDQDQLADMLIRVIRMLGYRVNVCDLAKSVYCWNEHTCKRWANQYYLNFDPYKKETNNESRED